MGVPYETIYFVGVHVGKGVLVLVPVTVGVRMLGEGTVGNGEPNTTGVGNVTVEYAKVGITGRSTFWADAYNPDTATALP
jgi:hypothetical protein